MIEFQTICEQLFARENIILNEEEISLMFELIATNLFTELAEKKGIYFDGVVNLSYIHRKSRQIKFNGEMWVGNGEQQWKEFFEATITDKRITKQGIWISIQVGQGKAEGDLFRAFHIENNF